MDLRKSLIIALNSAQVQSLDSIVACTPGSWEGWILTGIWYFEVLGKWLGKGRESGQWEEGGGSVEGERAEGQKEGGGLDGERWPGDKEGRIY